MNDFDSSIGKLLNESVDAQLGPRRPAPRFQPDRFTTTAAQPRRAAKPWIVPLLAAACVVAAAVGTIGASQALSHRHQPTPPASHVPPAPVSDPAPSPSVSHSHPSSPAGPATATSHSTTTSNTGTSSSTSTSPGNGSASTVQVTLGGATLSLPHGWVAHSYADLEPPGTGLTYPMWCLAPAGQHVSVQFNGCPLQFTSVPAIANGAYLDADNAGGTYGNGEYCTRPGLLSSTVTSADVTFGSRPADFRHWVLTCQGGSQVQLEQYVVASGPGYILFSDQADPAMHAVMDSIANTATVPSQTSQVRFYDHGYVRKLQPVSGGYLISVDRVVPSTSGPVNNNPATYDYLIPSSTYQGLYTKPKVGALVVIYTDGSRVLTVNPG